MARGTKGVQRTSSGRFKCKKKKIKLNIISNFCEKLITYFGFVYEIWEVYEIIWTVQVNGLKNLVLAELGSKCQTVICILIAVKNNFIICNS